MSLQGVEGKVKPGDGLAERTPNAFVTILPAPLVSHVVGDMRYHTSAGLLLS